MELDFGALVLIPLAIAFHPPRVPSLAAMGSVAALGIGAHRDRDDHGFPPDPARGRQAYLGCDLPAAPSAVFWGTVVSHERLRPETFVALLLILSGVFLITRPRRQAPILVEVAAEAPVEVPASV